MRNHSHCNRNKLAREGRVPSNRRGCGCWGAEGGCFAPSPGRNPGGAKNKQTKPASSSMPSDWYSEKSRAVDMNERKQTKQITSMARGQKFTRRSSEPIMPIQHSAINMPEPLEIQSKEGAYQKRTCATPDCATACRYSRAGRTP